MLFPTVSGYSLTGQAYTLPFGLEGEFNVLLVAFEPSQQPLLQSWMSSLADLESQYSRMSYYQLPTLALELMPSRDEIEFQMRSFIPEPHTHARVIPLYVDKTAFLNLLEIPDEDTVHLFLVDIEGQVLWWAEGMKTEASLASLTRVLNQVGDVDNEKS